MKAKRVVEDEIIDYYTRLRNLVKSNQNGNAEKFFDDNHLIKVWEPLLYYAMTRGNCQVSKVILKRVVSYRQFTLSELRVKTSLLLHDISYDFSNRVKSYITSGEFEAEFAKFTNVASTVHAQLRGRTGDGVVNLKMHHFSG